MGIPPPFYANLSPGKGRGLFSSRLIKEGELVHRGGGRGDVIFQDGPSWRRFVFSLPRQYACDIMDWQWTQQTEEGGPLKLYLGLDIATLMNGYNHKFSETIPNILPKNITSMDYYALRDIQKDEE